MRYKTIAFLLCCLYIQAVCCQQTALLDMDSSQTIPAAVKEKIYVHTDKSVYTAGEILWCKLYDVNAATNRLFDLSRIAYVELIDSLNKPVEQMKISLHSGLGKGSFMISPAVPSGSYRLRAYTSWMKNGSADDFFQKDITVINVQKLTVSSRSKEALPGVDSLYSNTAGLQDKDMNSNSKLSLTLSGDKSAYQQREKVVLSIEAPGTIENDSAFLSVSVYRIDSLQPLDGDRIDRLPAMQEDKAGIMKESKSFMYAPEYNGSIITGKIFSKTGEPQKDVMAYLSVPGKGTQFYPSVSDAEGNIRWETKDFFGASRLVVQTERGSSDNIQIDNPFSQSFSNSAFPHFTLPYNCPNTLSEHSISMQVSHIYTEAKLEQYQLPENDTLPFYALADKTYRLDDFVRFNTLEEVLREYIAMANVVRHKGSYHLPMYDDGSQKMFADDPLVLLDGVPFFNLDKFMSLDPQKIQKVDVVTRRFFYGAAMFDGILNWQSYSGDLAETFLDSSAVVMDYDGLNMPRKFYSPSYETGDQRDSHLPDFRNVLYWNPDVTVKDKQQLSFYTSDLPGKYAAVVQGISQSGRVGSRVITFEVKKTGE